MMDVKTLAGGIIANAGIIATLVVVMGVWLFVWVSAAYAAIREPHLLAALLYTGIALLPLALGVINGAGRAERKEESA